MLSDHHALIHARAGRDKEDPSLLQMKQRIGGSLSFAVCHQGTVTPILDRAVPGGIAVEEGMDNARPARLRQKA